MKYATYYGTLEKINLLVYIALMFYLRYKLVGFELSLFNLLGKIQGSAIALKVKEKVEALFDDYCQLYNPLTTQSGQSSGA